MKIAIINGPNLNLVGKREPGVYGARPLSDFLEHLMAQYPAVQFSCFQSNSEGALIDELQRVGYDCDGIVLNAGAFTHYSIAIADAIRAITAPVIEVHISNVHAREEFRHRSVLAGACRGVIAGLGLDVYRLAVEAFIHA